MCLPAGVLPSVQDAASGPAGSQSVAERPASPALTWSPGPLHGGPPQSSGSPGASTSGGSGWDAAPAALAAALREMPETARTAAAALAALRDGNWPMAFGPTDAWLLQDDAQLPKMAVPAEGRPGACRVTGAVAGIVREELARARAAAPEHVVRSAPQVRMPAGQR